MSKKLSKFIKKIVLWKEYDYEGEAIKIVKGLTDILRTYPNRSDNNLIKRVCKIVDEINGRGVTL